MKINFKITTECPANCKCCQERLHNYQVNHGRFFRDERVYNRIINLFLECGDAENGISITGGEPTIVKDLPSIVKMFTKENIKVGIDTNGWNVTESWLYEMEQANLSYLLFSFYSINKDIYNMLRGSENTELFQKASEALHSLKKYKKSNGSINIRQQVTLLKSNYAELPELLKLALNCNFDALSTAYYISAKEDHEQTMNQTDIGIFKNNTVKKIQEILYDSDLDPILIEDNIKRMNNIFEFRNMPLSQIAKGYYRPSGDMCYSKNKLAIYPNGDVVPCVGYDYIMESKEKVNILDCSYQQIMQSRLFACFWEKPYALCERCSNGYQIWLDLKNK